MKKHTFVILFMLVLALFLSAAALAESEPCTHPEEARRVINGTPPQLQSAGLDRWSRVR